MLYLPKNYLLFMLSLIIDTSASKQLVALGSNNSLVRKVLIPKSPQQSKHILPEVLKLLKLEDKTLHNLDVIAIGTGPGTFTGTRCGVMIAKSLAFGLSLPLLPFFSHSLYFLEENRPFWVASDAKSGKLYLSPGLSLKAPKLIEKEDLPLDRPIITPHDHGIPGAIESDPNPSLILKSLLKNNFIHPHDVEILYLRNP